MTVSGNSGNEEETDRQTNQLGVRLNSYSCNKMDV